jgi:hypothetical protein
MTFSRQWLSILCALAVPAPLAAQPAPSASNEPAARQGDRDAGSPIVVTGERPAPDEERRREASRFVDTYAVKTRIGQFARWHDPICVRAWGLPLALNARISNRVMDIAESIGVRADRSELCRPNVRIGFTDAPQATIERAAARNRMVIGFHYAAQRGRIMRVRLPVQAWYVTTARGLNGSDIVDDAGERAPGGHAGSRLGAGMSSGLGHALILADTRVAAGQQVEPLAELLAFVALAQIGVVAGCSESATILNLMNPACPPDRRPTALTRQDLAYLHALYRMDPELGEQMQRGSLIARMADDPVGR